MKLTLLGLLGLALSSQSTFAQETYDGYEIVRVAVDDTNREAIAAIVKKFQLQTWTAADTPDQEDIIVPPSVATSFAAKTMSMKKRTMNSDLGRAIREGKRDQIYSPGTANATWFNSYHPYADHVQFLEDLSLQFPKISELIDIGRSVEGRRLTAIRISNPGNATKPSIVFQGTLHAREWISTMVVEYVIFQLLKGHAQGSIKQFLDSFDFFIVPVVNPDGFLYSQTTDRLWRKNRRQNKGSKCDGVDITANWDFQWGSKGVQETDPCSEIYLGPAPASEPETRALMGLVDSRGAAPGGIKLYTDFHSFSQEISWPWSYTCKKQIPNNRQHFKLARKFIAALAKVNRTNYSRTQVCKTQGELKGTGIDYAYAVAKSEYSFLIELPPKWLMPGFELPPEKIRPVVEETWAGLEALLLELV